MFIKLAVKLQSEVRSAVFWSMYLVLLAAHPLIHGTPLDQGWVDSLITQLQLFSLAATNDRN